MGITRNSLFALGLEYYDLSWYVIINGGIYNLWLRWVGELRIFLGFHRLKFYSVCHEISWYVTNWFSEVILKLLLNKEL